MTRPNGWVSEIYTIGLYKVIIIILFFVIVEDSRAFSIGLALYYSLLRRAILFQNFITAF